MSRFLKIIENIKAIPFHLVLPVIVLLFCLLGACRQSTPHKASPPAPLVLERDTGLASYYHPSLEGNLTANGEEFSNSEMVAAHPTYPFGTVVRVINMEDTTSVEVRINDHGPTRINRKEGVIIDLSQAAAKKLRMMKDGRVKVRLEVLQWGNDKQE